MKINVIGHEKVGKTLLMNNLLKNISKNGGCLTKVSEGMAGQSEKISEQKNPDRSKQETPEFFEFIKDEVRYRVDNHAPEELGINGIHFDFNESMQKLKEGNEKSINVLVTSVFLINPEYTKILFKSLISKIQSSTSIYLSLSQAIELACTLAFHDCKFLNNNQLIKDIKKMDHDLILEYDNINYIVIFKKRKLDSELDSESQRYLNKGLDDIVDTFYEQNGHKLAPFQAIANQVDSLIVVITHLDLFDEKYILTKYIDPFFGKIFNKKNRFVFQQIAKKMYKTTIKNPGILEADEIPCHIEGHSGSFLEIFCNAIDYFSKNIRSERTIQRQTISKSLTDIEIPKNNSNPLQKTNKKRSKLRTIFNKIRPKSTWKKPLLIVFSLLLIFSLVVMLYIRLKTIENNSVNNMSLQKQLSDTINTKETSYAIAELIAKSVDISEIMKKIKSEDIANEIASKAVLPKIYTEHIVEAISKKVDINIDSQLLTELMARHLANVSLNSLYFITSKDAWLRKQPSNLIEDREFIIKPYTIVKMIEHQGSYYKITTGNITGWIYNKSIQHLNVKSNNLLFHPSN